MAHDTSRTEQPVVVAGAGPTGMSAALALRARGVPVTILEADPEDRDRPGSRAIYVHGATLRTLETICPGLGEQLVDNGLVWPTRRTLWEGKEVFSRTYSNTDFEGFPPFTSLPQVRTESFMLDAVEDAGVEVHWDTPVSAVEPREDVVTVRSEGGEEWETPYVVGADGAGSDVRKSIGAEFEGEESPNSFVIADVAEVESNPRAKERVFHYNHPAVDGRNVLLVPFTGGWRIDIQCLGTDDPGDLSEERVINDITGTVLGERYASRVEWVSDYTFLQITSDTFVDDECRVLLAGEAGHLFAPFGARGMNSGIADADAAASAIAVTLGCEVDGVARHEIETYGARRGQAAEWNKNAAGQALEYLQGDSPITKGKKRAAARLAEYWEPAGEWLDDAPYGSHGSPPVTVGRY